MKNPITTIIGLIVALCPVIGAVFPEVKSICEQLTVELIGLGFIASADGVKRPAVNVNPAINTVLIAVLGFSFVACTQLKQAGELLNPFGSSIKSVLAENAAGEYTVSVEKDGKVLYEKKILCTKNEKELTGCHEIQ